METAFALQNNFVLRLWARRLRHVNSEGAHHTLSHQCACIETCLDKQPEIFSILILQYNCDIKVGEEPGNETSRQPRSVVVGWMPYWCTGEEPGNETFWWMPCELQLSCSMPCICPVCNLWPGHHHRLAV